MEMQYIVNIHVRFDYARPTLNAITLYKGLHALATFSCLSISGKTRQICRNYNEKS
jgi:hypothetical protein